MSEKLSAESLEFINSHAVTIYRRRDPETKKLCHWTVVNEDLKERSGNVGDTLEEAIQQTIESA